MKEQYRENRYVKRWALAKRAIDYLGGKCYKCGESHPAALSFHHRNPAEKKFDVARVIQEAPEWETLKEEVDKCDLVCENCHRKLHFNQKRYDKNYERICNKANGVRSEREITMNRWTSEHIQKLVVLYKE